MKKALFIVLTISTLVYAIEEGDRFTGPVTDSMKDLTLTARVRKPGRDSEGDAVYYNPRRHSIVASNEIHINKARFETYVIKYLDSGTYQIGATQYLDRTMEPRKIEAAEGIAERLKEKIRAFERQSQIR
jgi:hypothetical protein